VRLLFVCVCLFSKWLYKCWLNNYDVLRSEIAAYFRLVNTSVYVFTSFCISEYVFLSMRAVCVLFSCVLMFFFVFDLCFFSEYCVRYVFCEVLTV